MEDNLVKTQSEKTNYYNVKSRKRNDVLIGLLGGVAVIVFLYSMDFDLGTALLSLIFDFFVVLILIGTGRGYIALGFGVMIAIPFLIFGGCIGLYLISK